MESIPTTQNSDDGSIAAALWSVVIAGALVTLGSVSLFGLRQAGSTALGAALAVMNLWAIGKLVRGLLGGGKARASWGPLGMLKLAAIFVVLGVVVKRGWVDVLPFALGYSALPLGIVLSQLKSNPAARGEN